MVEKFSMHLGQCIGGSTGRRVNEVINVKQANCGLMDDPGVPIGRVPLLSIIEPKNDKDQENLPVLQPLYPVYSNVFRCPALVG